MGPQNPAGFLQQIFIMLIICDLEIKDFNHFHNLPIEELSYILDIKEFVYSRIVRFKDDIEIEELLNEKAYSIIYILPGFRNGQVDFRYSSELNEKLNSCFTTKDWKLLSEKILR
jgi:hypothetical protein